MGLGAAFKSANAGVGKERDDNSGRVEDLNEEAMAITHEAFPFFILHCLSINLNFNFVSICSHYSTHFIDKRRDLAEKNVSVGTLRLAVGDQRCRRFFD